MAGIRYAKLYAYRLVKKVSCVDAAACAVQDEESLEGSELASLARLMQAPVTQSRPDRKAYPI